MTLFFLGTISLLSLAGSVGGIGCYLDPRIPINHTVWGIRTSVLVSCGLVGGIFGFILVTIIMVIP